MKKMKQSLRRLALAVMLAAVLSCCVFAAEADPATETPAQFYNAMQAHLDQREESFSIVYTGDMSELFQDPSAPGVGELLRAMSAQSTNSTGSGADYAALNVADGGIGIQGAKVYFSLEYLTSKAQETWIDQEVARLVDELNLDQEDDYTKVKLIYEYIGTNYFYDDSLEKFSAYEGLKTGTMVCQGYALLLYKMLWEAEVPSRIVTGMSQNEAHAWNIVKLGDYWYYLDVTWDARSESQDAMSWNYFLKSEEDFEGHSSFEPYRQTLYRARHPLSKTSYAAAHVMLSVDGDEVAALTIRKGVSVQLNAKVDGNTSRRFSFVSTGQDSIAVREDGTLTSLKPGYSSIIVTDTTDRSVIPAVLPVSAVDLTSCSDWASEQLNAFYLAGCLPNSLTTGFQDGITRAELSRLIYQFVLTTKGFPPLSIDIFYTDLTECYDWRQVMACTAMGFFDGTSATTFSPDEVVTREQAAKILVNVAAYLRSSSLEANNALAYEDADAISDWAKSYVQIAAEQGILQGHDGSFRPDGQLTLEQAIVALQRISTSATALDPAA